MVFGQVIHLMDSNKSRKPFDYPQKDSSQGFHALNKLEYGKRRGTIFINRIKTREP